jgi:tRNA pseudouridine38-40 synthase
LRYFFHIGFNGYNYRGWQRLPNIVSVQGVIETTVSQILKTPVTIVGCGRTDAQVHASQFLFHLDVEKEWDFDLLFRLNKTLPCDIAVFDIIQMKGLPHARFDAIQRTYDYFLHTYKDPFLSNVSSLYQGLNLDLGKMKKAVSILPDYNDFRAYCKSPDKYEHTICNVTSATLFTNKSGDKIRLQISSNRFLSGMIRIIIGKLLEIGSGALSVDEFEYHLKTQETPRDIVPAYPWGLYLSKVTYPYLDLLPRTAFSPLLHTLGDETWKEV